MKMNNIAERFDELIPLHVPFEFRVETMPDKMAYIDCTLGKNYTYSELDSEINRFANALGKDGIGLDDVVMVSLFNSVELVIANYAAWKLGGIFSPINYMFAPGDIAYCLEESQPKIYIYDEMIADSALQGIELSSFKPSKVLSSKDIGSYHASFSSDAPLRASELGAFDEALRLYTSGTTGRPKRVPHCHADVYICGLTHSLYGMHWTPLDVLMVLAPYFHAAGNAPAYIPALNLGMTLISIKKFSPEEALNAISKEKASFIMGPPIMFESVVNMAIEQKDTKLIESVRAAMLMGSPVPATLYNKLKKELGINVFNGDGSTEALYCHTLSPWDPEDKWDKEATAKNGIALPGNLIRVVKQYPDRKAEPDDLVPKDGNTVGEMIVKNLHHPGSYYNLPEKSQAAFRNGWYYTGDSGTWDADGYNHIVGRTDDMFNSGGEKIYADEVESRVNEHPGVSECIIVGVPDEKWGKVCTAYVVPQDSSLTIADLDEFLKAHDYLADYKRPRKYRFVSELPQTATGKKQRYKLRKQAVEDDLAGILEPI